MPKVITLMFFCHLQKYKLFIFRLHSSANGNNVGMDDDGLSHKTGTHGAVHNADACANANSLQRRS